MFPTLRLDYNLTNAHRLTFTYRYNDFNSTPDFLNSAEARFPGFPNLAGQVSGRYMWQGSLRSTFGKSMVNEVRVGGRTRRAWARTSARALTRRSSTARASAARAPAAGLELRVPGDWRVRR